MNWVLLYAPAVPASLAMTLMGLANHADPDGRGAYPKVPTLALYARKTPRSVAWDIDDLLELGLIREGDQRLVEHLPEGKRPKVYDLVLEKRRDPSRPEKPAARKGRKESRERTAQKKAEEASATPDPEDTPVPGDTSPDDSLTCPQGHPTPVPGDTSTPVPGDVSDLSPGTSPLIRNEPSLNRPVEPSFEPFNTHGSTRTATSAPDGMLPMPVVVPDPSKPPRRPGTKPKPKPKRPLTGHTATAAALLDAWWQHQHPKPTGYMAVRAGIVACLDAGWAAELIPQALDDVAASAYPIRAGSLETALKRRTAQMRAQHGANVRPFPGRRETAAEVLDRVEAQMNAGAAPGFTDFDTSRIVDSVVINPGATA